MASSAVTDCAAGVSNDPTNAPRRSNTVPFHLCAAASTTSRPWHGASGGVRRVRRRLPGQQAGNARRAVPRSPSAGGWRHGPQRVRWRVGCRRADDRSRPRPARWCRRSRNVGATGRCPLGDNAVASVTRPRRPSTSREPGVNGSAAAVRRRCRGPSRLVANARTRSQPRQDRVGEVGDDVEQMLAVVEHDQAVAPAQVIEDASCADIPARGTTPSARVTISSTASSASAAASSHNHTPSRASGSTSAATCTARGGSCRPHRLQSA